MRDEAGLDQGCPRQWAWLHVVRLKIEFGFGVLVLLDQMLVERGSGIKECQVDCKLSESGAPDRVQVQRYKLEHDQLIKKHETGYDSLGREWKDRSRVQNHTHLPKTLLFGHFPAPLIKDL